MNNSLFTIIMCLAPVFFHAQSELPIPPLDEGAWIDGGRSYDLLMSNGFTEFTPGVFTPTSGYNGSYLGPTLLMHQGDSVVLNVTNNLEEVSTTHWHGFHVPAHMDGGPHQIIPDNDTWTATFNMLNVASTFWYHPHHKPTFWSDSDGTGGQVHRGLAGMIIVEDDISDNLSLPKTYGVDDTNNLTIDLGALTGLNTTIKIYDSSSKLVFEKQSSSTLMIDVSGYAKGLYTLELSTSDKVFRSQVVIE